jgi:hypothetical protein
MSVTGRRARREIIPLARTKATLFARASVALPFADARNRVAVRFLLRKVLH